MPPIPIPYVSIYIIMGKRNAAIVSLLSWGGGISARDISTSCSVGEAMECALFFRIRGTDDDAIEQSPPSNS